MKTLKSKIISLVLALSLAFTLTGCSASFDPAHYVQLELNSTYHGNHADELVDMYTDGTTLEDLEYFHTDNALQEALLFLDFQAVEIEYLSQETQDRATELFKEIYNNVSFEVLESNEIDGDFHVSVKFFPVDAGFNAITDEEWTTILDTVYPTEVNMTPESEDMFANLLLDEVEAHMSSIAQTEEQILTIIIDVESDGSKTINSDSWYAFDAELIPYYDPAAY